MNVCSVRAVKHNFVLFCNIYNKKCYILKLEPENCCSEKLLLVADYVSPLLMHLHVLLV